MFWGFTGHFFTCTQKFSCLGFNSLGFFWLSQSFPAKDLHFWRALWTVAYYDSSGTPLPYILSFLFYLFKNKPRKEEEKEGEEQTTAFNHSFTKSRWLPPVFYVITMIIWCTMLMRLWMMMERASCCECPSPLMLMAGLIYLLKSRYWIFIYFLKNEWCRFNFFIFLIGWKRSRRICDIHRFTHISNTNRVWIHTFITHLHHFPNYSTKNDIFLHPIITHSHKRG